jgi:hypothetical protein
MKQPVEKGIMYPLSDQFLRWAPLRSALIRSLLRLMAMMDNNSLHLRQPMSIFQSGDRMTFSARPMQCLGKSSEFHFSARRHHLHRCHAVIASKHHTDTSLRLPGP